MRKQFSKFALTAITGIAIIFTTSCDAAGNPSALVGRWIGVSGDQDKGVIMELLSDGTGIATKNSILLGFNFPPLDNFSIIYYIYYNKRN